MDSSFLFYLILGLVNLVCGLYVVARRRTLTTLVFSLFTFIVSLWIIAIGTAYTTGTLWAARLTFAAATLMLVVLITLLSVFPVSPLPRTPLYRFFAASGLLLTPFALTPLLVRDISGVDFDVTLTYGPLHPIFAVYVYTALGHCLLIIFRKLRHSTGLAQLQVRYLLLGLVLPGIGITVTNLLIPILYTTSRFGRYGPLFSLIFVGFTAHTLIRHRLLDIRLVVSRTIAYTIALVISTGLLVTSFLLVPSLRTPDPNRQTLWLELILLLAAVVSFNGVRRLVQKALDRYLYRQSYDFELTIRNFSETIAATLDLTAVLDRFVHVLAKAFSPEHVTLYWRLDPDADLLPLASRIQLGDPPTFLPLASNTPLVQLLHHRAAPILHDDVTNEPDPGLRRDLNTALGQLHAAYLHPLFEDRRLIAVLAIGSKLSGDPFYEDDLSLTATLVNQTHIAAKNALLFRDLRLAHEHLQQIMSNMDSAVVALSADGAITLFNASAARLTGLDPQDASSARVDLLPSQLRLLLRRSLQTGTPVSQIEISIRTGREELIPVLCSTSLIHDRDGLVIGLVAVINDLTRLRHLEDEKRSSERLASIGAMAAGIAHEIRNPLVAIKTFAELLPERFSEADFRNDFSRLVVGEIDRISDLVARLRGFAADVRKPQVPCDIRQVIEETLALLRGQLDYGRIAVDFSIRDEIPKVSGDYPQLKQLLLNLLLNSVEAMPAGGRLSIEASLRRDASQDHLVIEIADTGVGIPSHLLETVFDPFVTTKRHGSGLGLSICKTIADSHRAVIRLSNNADGPGATATVSFPVASGDAVS